MNVLRSTTIAPTAFLRPLRDLFTALARPDAAAALDAACQGDPSSTLLLALDEDGVP